MKGPLFLNQFEIALKQLHAKKGCSSKKRILSHRMIENPLFHLSETKINGLCPSDEKNLTTLSHRLQAFL